MFSRLLRINVKHNIPNNINIPNDETKNFLIRPTDLENRIVKIQDNVEILTYSLYTISFLNFGGMIVKMLW
jgi:hypothetical protein